MDKDVLYRPESSRAIELLEQKMIDMRVYSMSIQLNCLTEMSMGRLHHILNILTKKASTIHHTIFSYVTVLFSIYQRTNFHQPAKKTIF